MLDALGYFHDGVKIHHALVEPVRVAPKHRYRGIGAGVELAAQKRGVDFRRGVAGDEFGIFEADQKGEETAGDVRNMADRLGADAQAGCGAQFLQAIQPQFPAGVDGLVADALRRAEIDKLVEVV